MSTHTRTKRDEKTPEDYRAFAGRCMNQADREERQFGAATPQSKNLRIMADRATRRADQMEATQNV